MKPDKESIGSFLFKDNFFKGDFDMSLSIEQCNLSIKELDNAVKKFERQVRHSGIKSEELDEIDKKIQETMMQLQKTLDVLKEESEDSACVIWSEKKLIALSTITAVLTGGGVLFTALTSEALKWVGVGFTILAGGTTGCTTCYTAKMSMDADKKAQLEKLSQEGLTNAKSFNEFISMYKQIQKEKYRKLKHSVKAMEKRKSFLKDQLEKSEQEFRKSQTLLSMSIAKPFPTDESAEKSIQKDSDNSIGTAEESPNVNLELTEKIGKIQSDPQSPQLEMETTNNQIIDSHHTKKLDEKITQCLSRYEALPTKYKKNDVYLKLVSNFIQYLPDQDPLKQEFQQLTSSLDDMIEEGALSNEQEDVPAKEKSSELRIISLPLHDQMLKKEAKKEFDKAKRFDLLTNTVANRFKIRSAIPHLDAPNGYRVTSRGTVRLKRKESHPSQSSFKASKPEVMTMDMSTFNSQENQKRSNRKRSESNVV